MSEQITGLLVFPDYCASGLWARYNHEQSHVSIDVADLPFALHPHIVNKIRIMSEAYDVFGYPHGDAPPSLTHEGSFAFMMYEIYEDIKHHHPDLEPLLVVPEWAERLFDPTPDAFLHRYHKPGKSVVCADIGEEPIEDITKEGFKLVETSPLKKMGI